VRAPTSACPSASCETDGTELVVVQRTDLDLDTEGGALELAYADNRVAELDLDWDVAELLADRDAGLDLAAVGFDADELAALLAGLDAPTEGLTDPDAVPGVPEMPITKPGDMWTLGRHRLLCGDSTVATDVERLLGGATAAQTDGHRPALRGGLLDAEVAQRGSADMIGVRIERRTGTCGERLSAIDWQRGIRPRAHADVAYVWHADRHASDRAGSLSKRLAMRCAARSSGQSRVSPSVAGITTGSMSRAGTPSARARPPRG
jgi:hypothetical protein